MVDLHTIPFDDSLEMGGQAEEALVEWIRGRGNAVLPVGLLQNRDGRGGAHLFLKGREVAVPDLLIFPPKSQVFWAEAKRKAGFTLHRNSGDWCTGTNRRYYENYCAVADITSIPVYVLFWIDGRQTKGSPPNNTSGLFGATLVKLSKNIHHVVPAAQMGASGIVFWKTDVLTKLASLDEVLHRGESLQKGDGREDY